MKYFRREISEDLIHKRRNSMINFLILTTKNLGQGNNFRLEPVISFQIHYISFSSMGIEDFLFLFWNLWLHLRASGGLQASGKAAVFLWISKANPDPEAQLMKIRIKRRRIRPQRKEFMLTRLLLYSASSLDSSSWMSRLFFSWYCDA